MANNALSTYLTSPTESSKGSSSPLEEFLIDLMEQKVNDDCSVAPIDSQTTELLSRKVTQFVETLVKSSCDLAQHRNSPAVADKDFSFHLERTWNMCIPGFKTDRNPIPIDAEADEIHLLTMQVKREAELSGAQSGNLKRPRRRYGSREKSNETSLKRRGRD